MEVSSNKYRAMAAALVILPDCISEMSLALLAYYLPIWQSLTLGFSIVCVIILILVLAVPESPRWLLSKGKVDDAICVITRAAKWNKLSTDQIRDAVMENYETLGIKDNNETSATCLDLFTNKSLRKNTVTTLMIWTLTGSMYLGIYQYMTLLSSNVYLTLLMIGLLQVPLCVIQLFRTKYFGRKSTMIGLLTISGIALLILIFTPEGHWSSSMLGLIGFSACCISLSIVYVYHGELYPTSLIMASPFIATIYLVWIPSSIFATMAFVAVALCFLLPEIKGKNLKDSVDKHLLNYSFPVLIG